MRLSRSSLCLALMLFGIEVAQAQVSNVEPAISVEEFRGRLRDYEPLSIRITVHSEENWGRQLVALTNELPILEVLEDDQVPPEHMILMLDMKRRVKEEFLWVFEFQRSVHEKYDIEYEKDEVGLSRLRCLDSTVKKKASWGVVWTKSSEAESTKTCLERNPASLSLGLEKNEQAFTLRTTTVTSNTVKLGWTDEVCIQKTCNAHNVGPCYETITIVGDEGESLGPPFKSRCAPSDKGRCKYYAKAYTPEFASDGRAVKQRWRMKSLPANICLKVTRYTEIPQTHTVERAIVLGAEWLELEAEGQHELVNEEIDESYEINDVRFERNGMRIRLAQTN